MSNFKETITVYPDGGIRINISYARTAGTPRRIEVSVSYCKAILARIGRDLGEAMRNTDGLSARDAMAKRANSHRLVWADKRKARALRPYEATHTDEVEASQGAARLLDELGEAINRRPVDFDAIPDEGDDATVEQPERERKRPSGNSLARLVDKL
jgi:hypothetical protein